MIQAHDIVLFDKHEIEGFPLPEWVVLTEKMFGTVVRRQITPKYYRLDYVALPAIRDGQQKSQNMLSNKSFIRGTSSNKNRIDKRKSWIILFISNCMLLETYYQDASGESAAA